MGQPVEGVVISVNKSTRVVSIASKRDMVSRALVLLLPSVILVQLVAHAEPRRHARSTFPVLSPCEWECLLAAVSLAYANLLLYLIDDLLLLNYLISLCSCLTAISGRLRRSECHFSRVLQRER